MDESAFPTHGREDKQTAGHTDGVEPPGERGQADVLASAEAADTSSPTPLETQPTETNKGRLRRFRPLAITAVGVLMAAIAIGVFRANQPSVPEPVAQLAVRTDATAAIPMDDEAARTFEGSGLTQDDFVSHGPYGVLQVWSATKQENGWRCLALVVGDHVSVFHCTPPTEDTIADYNIDPHLVPPAPNGENAWDVRFILRDDVVDVYLSPERVNTYY
jgi:hypothetical protein